MSTTLIIEKLVPLRYVLIPSKIVEPSNLIKHRCETRQLPINSLEPKKPAQHVHTMRPALFFFSSSFLTSAIFSSKDLPQNSSPRILTFSFGRGGFSLPQTRSTRLDWIPTRLEPPFFLIFSASLRASAMACQG
jgi:hypothetical protein